jgi:hypothetical protein
VQALLACLKYFIAHFGPKWELSGGIARIAVIVRNRRQLSKILRPGLISVIQCLSVLGFVFVDYTDSGDIIYLP